MSKSKWAPARTASGNRTGCACPSRGWRRRPATVPGATTRLGRRTGSPPGRRSGAGAHGVVEGKNPRFQLLQGIGNRPGRRTWRRRDVRSAFPFQGDGPAVGVAQRRLERFGQALAHVVAHFSRSTTTSTSCFCILWSFGHGVDFIDRAVHPHPGEKPCARSSAKRSNCSPLRVRPPRGRGSSAGCLPGAPGRDRPSADGPSAASAWPCSGQ